MNANLTEERLKVGPDELRTAARTAVEALAPTVDRDWSVRAGDLDWDAAATLDHTVRSLVFYAVHLAYRATDQPPFVVTPSVVSTDPPRSPAGLLAALDAMAAVLADVGTAAAPEVRAWHPWGHLPDVEGFMAMGCDEILMHAEDIARGLGVALQPPEALCQRVLARLFPWAPTDVDPWSALRWASGRMALDGHPRLGPDWNWHCAPLAEWDGSTAKLPPEWVAPWDTGPATGETAGSAGVA
jgi:uncharacterized protein (TIGR03083 family)